MKKLTNAIAGISAAACAVVSGTASAYDTVGWTHDNTGPASYHLITSFIESELCDTTCANLGGDAAVGQMVIEIQNQWYITNAAEVVLNPVGSVNHLSAAPGGLFAAGSSASMNTSAVVDYVNAPGNQIAQPAMVGSSPGAQVLAIAQSVGRPNLVGFNVPMVGQIPVAGSGQYERHFGPYEWDITTNAEGKVVDGGYTLYTSLNSGEKLGAYWPIAGNYQFGCIVEAANNMPSIADWETQSALYQGQTPATLGADIVDTPDTVGSGTNSCVVAGATVINYLTCDPRRGCEGLPNDKTVPVPAFAAATLGLGLVGITMLTGRRRSIK